MFYFFFLFPWGRVVKNQMLTAAAGRGPCCGLLEALLLLYPSSSEADKINSHPSLLLHLFVLRPVVFFYLIWCFAVLLLHVREIEQLDPT